jgi:hypothetical protein
MESETSPIKGIRQDLFEAIKYKRVSGKTGPVYGIQFPRRFVLKWNFDVTWKYVTAGIHVVNRYKPHTTEGLFNNVEVWDSCGIEAHRDFGRCLAHFVNGKMLPLSCFNPHESNKEYLISGQ